MKEVNFPADFVYAGGDIAGSLIEENIKRYASDKRRFLRFDVVKDEFPESDVWFCRDCLFHLPEAYVFEALRNFCDSKSSS